MKYEGPPRPEDDDDDDDLCYEPSPPPPKKQQLQHDYIQNLHKNTNIMSMKRTPSLNINTEIVKKDSFTNLIINTSTSHNNTDKHPTDVSLLTTATSFPQEVAVSSPCAPNNSKNISSTCKISSNHNPNFDQYLQTFSLSNSKKTKSNVGGGGGNNGPPRPDLYDIDERSVVDNVRANYNSMGLPLVIESGVTNHYDNESLLSCEESLNASSTIGSESLANILCKIEHVKDELSTPLLSMTGGGDGHNNDGSGGDNISYGSSKFKSEISNQMEMAQLIERLASAAIAVKQMERSKKSSL